MTKPYKHPMADDSSDITVNVEYVEILDGRIRELEREILRQSGVMMAMIMSSPNETITITPHVLRVIAFGGQKDFCICREDIPKDTTIKYTVIPNPERKRFTSPPAGDSSSHLDTEAVGNAAASDEEEKQMKFRKKPVVIEAEQYHGSNGRIIETWSGGAVVQSPVLEPTENNPTGEYLQIKTLEGTMTAIVGDWIICGVNGEFYPCKPDIFDKTYEAVEELQH